MSYKFEYLAPGSTRSRTIPASAITQGIAERNALSQNLQNLEAAIAALPTDDSAQKVLRMLDDAQAHVAEVDRLILQPCWSNMPGSSDLTNRKQTKAMKVFETTELMEQILSYLPLLDLFKVQSVCRIVHDTIEGSSTLKKAMGLVAEERSEPSLPFLLNRKFSDLDGVDFSNYDNDWTDSILRFVPESHLIAEARAHFFIQYHPGCTPKLTRRCRAILICQPPVKTISLTPFFDNVYYQSENVTAKTGGYITMGDIEDLSQEVWKKHSCNQRSCRLVPEHHVIEFEGLIQLEEDGALMKRRRAEVKKEIARRDAEARRIC